MKELFLYLREKAMSIPSIKWADLDKGQLERYDSRPAIDFPAILFKIEYPKTENIQRKTQKCQVLITTRVVFDFVDDTDSIAPDELLQQSLEYLDTVKEVYKAFQGEIDRSAFNAPLERTRQTEQNNPDGLKIVDIPFGTWILDESAQ